MEKLIAYIFLLSFAFANSGCKRQNSPLLEPNPKSNASMITLDIYRGAIDLGLSLIYDGTQCVIVLKPNGLQSLDFEEKPPPPPGEQNANYNVPNHHIEKIKVEALSLEKEKVEIIENLINALEDKDLKSVINIEKFDNGIGIKVTIVFSDNDIRDFSIINGATENQKKVLNYIFDQAILNSKLNKELLELFLR